MARRKSEAVVMDPPTGGNFFLPDRLNYTVELCADQRLLAVLRDATTTLWLVDRDKNIDLGNARGFRVAETADGRFVPVCDIVVTDAASWKAALAEEKPFHLRVMDFNVMEPVKLM
jgi:hypothetical protein